MSIRLSGLCSILMVSMSLISTSVSHPSFAGVVITGGGGGGNYHSHGESHGYPRGGYGGGYWYGGGWGGPNVIINVPVERYYAPPPCERVEVCNEYDECWLERYCR